MRAKREYRDRDSVEVSVLDALVDRSDEGMTVFEIRSHVEADIDDIEGALATLKDDDLIVVEDNGDRTVIKPDDSVVPDPGEPQDPEESIFDRVRDRLPF
ncbi:MarR family transcriptional regulator [Halobacteriales archaeon QS_9_68_17]|nr:MAG: MarR family transcriptional regulator [Halobacteriales archaeon QS_9_68_17]